MPVTESGDAQEMRTTARSWLSFVYMYVRKSEGRSSLMRLITAQDVAVMF